MCPDRDGDPSEKKRKEIALWMLRRGHCPDIASVLTQEGLAKLERRRDEIELLEAMDIKLSRNNWIFLLLGKKTKQLPLQYDDLPKDPVRVMKLQKEKQCSALVGDLYDIKDQIKNVTRYSYSEYRLADLEKEKSRIEKELRQNKEDLTTLENKIRDNKDNDQ